MKQASSYDRHFFCFLRGSSMVATGQEIVRKKKCLQGKVREFHFESGRGTLNFTLLGDLTWLPQVRN